MGGQQVLEDAALERQRLLAEQVRMPLGQLRQQRVLGAHGPGSVGLGTGGRAGCGIGGRLGGLALVAAPSATARALAALALGAGCSLRLRRTGEGRGGEEGRSPGWPVHLKKKKDTHTSAQ